MGNQQVGKCHKQTLDDDPEELERAFPEVGKPWSIIYETPLEDWEKIAEFHGFNSNTFCSKSYHGHLLDCMQDEVSYPQVQVKRHSETKKERYDCSDVFQLSSRSGYKFECVLNFSDVYAVLRFSKFENAPNESLYAIFDTAEQRCVGIVEFHSKIHSGYIVKSCHVSPDRSKLLFLCTQYNLYHFKAKIFVFMSQIHRTDSGLVNSLNGFYGQFNNNNCVNNNYNGGVGYSLGNNPAATSLSSSLSSSFSASFASSFASSSSAAKPSVMKYQFVETFDTISPGRIAPSLSFDPRYFLTRIATLQYNYDDLNYRLCIYDLKTKKILRSVESYLSHSGEKFMRCNFSKDGHFIAVCVEKIGYYVDRNNPEVKIALFDSNNLNRLHTISLRVFNIRVCYINMFPMFSECGTQMALLETNKDLDGAIVKKVKVYQLPIPLDLQYRCRITILRCCRTMSDLDKLKLPKKLLYYLKFWHYYDI